LETEFEIMV